MSLTALNIEEFVADQLYRNTIEPGVEKLFSDDWDSMVTTEKQALLNEFIVKVEYDKLEGQVSITLQEDKLDCFAHDSAASDSVAP